MGPHPAEWVSLEVAFLYSALSAPEPPPPPRRDPGWVGGWVVSVCEQADKQNACINKCTLARTHTLLNACTSFDGTLRRSQFKQCTDTPPWSGVHITSGDRNGLLKVWDARCLRQSPLVVNTSMNDAVLSGSMLASPQGVGWEEG